ncbi:unnamed protein product [Prunus armeniaca]
MPERVQKVASFCFLMLGSFYKWDKAMVRGAISHEGFKVEAISATSHHRVNKMSNTESEYNGSPRAFEGESSSGSSTAKLESADFKSAEIGWVDSSQPSTSSRVEVTEADVSVAAPAEGVLTVVIDL